MAIEYTSKWKGFQFRSPVYLDGRKPDPTKFELVKWEHYEPREVTDWYTGEKTIATDSCFTIGTLIWNPKEEYFKFESCGLRYLEYCIDGLNEWIMAFAKMKELELKENYYD